MIRGRIDHPAAQREAAVGRTENAKTSIFQLLGANAARAALCGDDQASHSQRNRAAARVADETVHDPRRSTRRDRPSRPSPRSRRQAIQRAAMESLFIVSEKLWKAFHVVEQGFAGGFRPDKGRSKHAYSQHASARQGAKPKGSDTSNTTPNRFAPRRPGASRRIRQR